MANCLAYRQLICWIVSVCTFLSCQNKVTGVDRHSAIFQVTHTHSSSLVVWPRLPAVSAPFHPKHPKPKAERRRSSHTFLLLLRLVFFTTTTTTTRTHCYCPPALRPSTATSPPLSPSSRESSSRSRSVGDIRRALLFPSSRVRLLHNTGACLLDDPNHEQQRGCRHQRSLPQD